MRHEERRRHDLERGGGTSRAEKEDGCFIRLTGEIQI